MFGRTELSVKALVQRAGPKFSGEDQIFQKKLVRGTKIFSEKIGPGTKIFRTKIPVTDLSSTTIVCNSLSTRDRSDFTYAIRKKLFNSRLLYKSHSSNKC